MNLIPLSIRPVVFFIFTLFFIIISSCDTNEKRKVDTVPTEDTSIQNGEIKVPREQSLYIGGFQWGPPSSFNPLAITPAWPVTGNVNLVYESMFGYNLIDGKLYGIIGKSYALSENILTVNLNENAKWSNGEPLTSADVVYTFELHRKYSTNSSLAWNYISKIYENGLHSVIIELSNSDFNPLIVKDIIASLPILPKKVFTEIEKDAFRQVGQTTSTAPDNDEIIDKIRELKNDTGVVASGPYTLHSYTDDLIILVRRDSYWGTVIREKALPAPRYIVHRSYPSNDDYNIALQKGDLDISATFFPQIWNAFTSGIKTWYSDEPYYIPGAIPMLYMGLSKPPFNDPAFRRAVAHSIDYEMIRNRAMFGYSPRLQPGMILPFGPEKGFFSNDDVKSLGSLYDPRKAKSLLRSAGYSWDTDSLLIDPAGKKIRTLYIQCPKGWTDWETAISIAAEGMRAIGIDVMERFVEYSVWDDDLKRGLFDFTMKTPHPEQTASLPWSRFEQVMSSRDLLPVGEIVYHNEGRYKNPAADQLLAKIPMLTDSLEAKSLYIKLNNLFISEMPVIPLMYRPWMFYQFNTKYWQNFPVESNPFAPPQCLIVGAGIGGLWGIKPVAK